MKRVMTYEVGGIKYDTKAEAIAADARQQLEDLFSFCNGLDTQTGVSPSDVARFTLENAKFIAKQLGRYLRNNPVLTAAMAAEIEAGADEAESADAEATQEAA